MVIDMNGWTKGVIGRNMYKDSTLNNMPKAELIKLLHIAQYNYDNLRQMYANAVDNSKCHRCPLAGMNEGMEFEE